MSKTVLFHGHSQQIELFAVWAEAIDQFFGYDSVVVVLHAQDYERACQTGRFTRVINLCAGFEAPTSEYDFTTDLDKLTAFEQKYDTCSFAKDWPIDRVLFRNVPRDFIVKWTSHVADKLQRLFNELRLAAIVQENVFISQRIIYHIAGRKGIRVLYPLGGRFFERVRFEKGLALMWSEARKRYQELEQQSICAETLKIAEEKYKDITERRQKLVFEKKKYIRGIEPLRSKLRIEKVCHYVTRLHKIASKEKNNPYASYLTHTLSPLEVLSNHPRTLQRVKYIERITTKILPKGKFVSYFMHFQPEYSVDALGIYSNQVEFIRNLSSYLPVDVLLAVKVNPLSVGRGLLHDYGKITSLPNVVLVADYVDSHIIIQSSEAVVTITGTVGMEAIMYGIPCIVMGDVFYRDFDGAFYAADYRELEKHLSILLSTNFDKGAFAEGRKWRGLKLLSALYESSYPADIFGILRYGHQDDENITKLKHAIVSEISKIEKRENLLAARSGNISENL
jgi:hypothetical protein